MKRAMVRFRGGGGGGGRWVSWYSWDAWGSRKKTPLKALPVKGDLLGKSLGSHGAAEPEGRMMCHVNNDCKQETTSRRSISVLLLTRDGALSPTTKWSTRDRLDPCVRSKSYLSSKARSPFDRGLVYRATAWAPDERNGCQNGDGGVFFASDPKHKDKTLLLNITIVHPCVSTNLGKAARPTEKHLADTIEREHNTTFEARFPPYPLSFLSPCLTYLV